MRLLIKLVSICVNLFVMSVILELKCLLLFCVVGFLVFLIMLSGVMCLIRSDGVSMKEMWLF